MSDQTFGLCRDCKNWQASGKLKSQIADYPRDKPVKDGWIEAVCHTLKLGLSITVSAGWEGGVVDSIETDANFGCRFFEKGTNE